MITDNLKICPECGCPVESTTRAPTAAALSPQNKKILIAIAAFVAVAVAVVVLLYNFNDDFNRGLKNVFAKIGSTVTDTDGNTYRTKVYNGVAWMIDNSQKTTSVTGCSYRSIDRGSYGRLYSWNCAAKACPDGWSLPTDEDFEALVSALDARGASAWKDWNSGSSLAGFSYYDFHGDQGSYGRWWSRSSSNRGWYVSSGSTSGHFVTGSSNNSFSVRCRKSQ
jgi:uncharacterized protein (TIGR02145 family)